MREYKVIDSAASVEQLRRRLKNEELEQYGDPFTPEFVYEAIRKLPRFASMRVSHLDLESRSSNTDAHVAGPPAGCRGIPWLPP
jgi:hypothetical protein